MTAGLAKADRIVCATDFTLACPCCWQSFTGPDRRAVHDALFAHFAGCERLQAVLEEERRWRVNHLSEAVR